MRTALDYLDNITVEFVNDAIFIVDAAAPKSAQIVG
jgi:hypothetical protein